MWLLLLLYTAKNTEKVWLVHVIIKSFPGCHTKFADAFQMNESKRAGKWTGVCVRGRGGRKGAREIADVISQHFVWLFKMIWLSTRWTRTRSLLADYTTVISSIWCEVICTFAGRYAILIISETKIWTMRCVCIGRIFNYDKHCMDYMVLAERERTE